MIRRQFALMKMRRFWPLFVAQFLSAFNDNFFKTALVVSVAYGIIDTGRIEPEILVTAVAGVFVLPFILLPPLGGGLADKLDKGFVIRRLKAVELVIALLAIAGLFIGSPVFLLFVLFLLGVKSALFSPSKYAILPQHLGEDELIGGNALVNTATFLAILLGTIMGSLLLVSSAGQLLFILILLFSAVSGYWASRYIPPAPASAADVRLSYNLITEGARVIRYAYRQPHGVFTALLGGSWFFFVGGLCLAQLPNYTSQILRVDNQVLTFFLTIFSIGIGIGGLLNNRLLSSRVAATFVPLASLGIALFAFDLYWASVSRTGQPMAGLGEFLSHASNWRIVIDLLGISVCGGLYIVPLKSIVQSRTPREHIARTMAAGALMDSVFVLFSAILAIVLFGFGFKVHDLFFVVAVLGVPVTLYIVRLSDKGFCGGLLRSRRGSGKSG